MWIILGFNNPDQSEKESENDNLFVIRNINYFGLKVRKLSSWQCQILNIIIWTPRIQTKSQTIGRFSIVRNLKEISHIKFKVVFMSSLEYLLYVIHGTCSIFYIYINKKYLLMKILKIIHHYLLSKIRRAFYK